MGHSVYTLRSHSRAWCNFAVTMLRRVVSYISFFTIREPKVGRQARASVRHS